MKLRISIAREWEEEWDNQKVSRERILDPLNGSHIPGSIPPLPTPTVWG